MKPQKIKVQYEGKEIEVCLLGPSGMPLCMPEKGTEPTEFDIPRAMETIEKGSGERDTLRADLEGAKKVVASVGDLDLEKARAALATMGSLDQKKLDMAAELERVRKEAKDAVETQLTAERTTSAAALARLRNQLYEEKLGNVFANSKFVKDKLILPAPIAKATFGANLQYDADGKVVGGGGFHMAEDGSMVPYHNGQKIPSIKNPGNAADPDEAIEMMLRDYPFKNDILRGTGAGGSGAPATTDAATGKHVIPRSQASNPQVYRAAKEAAAKAGTELVISD